MTTTTTALIPILKCQESSLTQMSSLVQRVNGFAPVVWSLENIEEPRHGFSIVLDTFTYHFDPEIAHAYN